MKVLVTGAAGFLGKCVVSQLLHRQHTVRAVVRTDMAAPPQEWLGRVEIVSADLQNAPALDKLFNGMDVLIHLAATVRGTAAEQREGTVVTTERLLEAMRTVRSVQHLVLAGSCSVYDWRAVQSTLNEDSPLEMHPENRDGYTASKILQEALTRRFALENKWTLSVLHPGIIYGPGSGNASIAGIRVGPLLVVIAPRGRRRLTHVENCADAFVKAAELRAEGTFNVIDDEHISGWRYAAKLLRNGNGSLRIPVPYHAGLAMACTATAASYVLPSSSRKKMPGILNTREYCARFKPLRYDNSRAKRLLQWQCQTRFDTGWSSA